MYRRKPLLSTAIFLVILFFSPFIFEVQAGENGGAYEILTDATTGEVYYIQSSERFKKTEGPVVAVALGGGGARALVNVGILKALEEEAIPVDLVLGSSMGAIVAVLYGSGLRPTEIEALVTSDLLPSMFDLNYPFIRSIIDTRRVNFFLESVSPVKRLEDFPIPTALLSYDLADGVKYVHTVGPISREIQGSYAIPLFFPVVEYDGLYLMDPGILELTPAQTAKVLGADVVISTTAFDALPYDTYDLPVRAWTRFINLIKEDNSKRVIDEYSDLTIHCQVGEYSFMDYHLAGEFIAIGYREAKKLMPQIKQVLAEKGIPLRPPLPSTPAETGNSLLKTGDISDLNRVISDVKADRLLYDFTRLKPLLYFGKEHSVFKQRLLPEECVTLQYGIFFQHKNTEIQVLTGGGKPRALEAQLRFIRLTPTFDLISRLYRQEQAGGGNRQGSGVACELNLLGIKPFSFGGYFAYDLAAETWRSSLTFDLVF